MPKLRDAGLTLAILAASLWTQARAGELRPFPRFGVAPAATAGAPDLHTASGVLQLTNVRVENVGTGRAPAGCPVIGAPARRLDTPSKYRAGDVTRSVIDEPIAAAREAQLAPTRLALRQLRGAIATRSADACVAKALREWAQLGALTDMASSDAFLTRDRFVADIAAALLTLRERGQPVATEAIVQAWLLTVARGTVEFYDWRAGPVARRNNHRYWAGLAVGTIGVLLEDASLTGWAERSYQIGVCQVDARGVLPLEEARDERAWDYHLYALRPLAAFRELAERYGVHLDDRCTGGLERLAWRTRLAEANGLITESHASALPPVMRTFEAAARDNGPMLLPM